MTRPRTSRDDRKPGGERGRPEGSPGASPGRGGGQQKTDFSVPENGSKKWPPPGADYVYGTSVGGAGKWPHFSAPENQKK